MLLVKNRLTEHDLMFNALIRTANDLGGVSDLAVLMVCVRVIAEMGPASRGVAINLLLRADERWTGEDCELDREAEVAEEGEQE